MFFLIFVFAFGYYEIKLFLKKCSNRLLYFQRPLCFWSIDMFLKCSWIVLEFSFQILQATLLKQKLFKVNKEDITKIPLTLFCYFLVTLGKLFPAWPNNMHVFKAVLFLYFWLNLIWYKFQKLIIILFSLMFLLILNS